MGFFDNLFGTGEVKTGKAKTGEIKTEKIKTGKIKTAGIQSRLDDAEAKIRDFDERLREADEKFGIIEGRLLELQEQIERGLKTALDQSLNLKRKTDEQLRELRASISAQMEPIEKILEGELNQARRREIKELLRRARARLTSINKLTAANENIPSAAPGMARHG